MATEKSVAQSPSSPSMTPQAPSQPAPSGMPAGQQLPSVVGTAAAQPLPVGAQPGMQPSGTQPGMIPGQKKSKWWLWVILGLGVVILLGLLAYFVFF
ncbi:MAG: hypothetical protein Q8P81_01625 [Nanoarchaeota archaeon]|nr:hypothetical protein [Nanoarchaeota archaeon]